MFAHPYRQLVTGHSCFGLSELGLLEDRSAVRKKRVASATCVGRAGDKVMLEPKRERVIVPGAEE